MASSARIGKGTLLKIGDAASPEVFTTIAEMVTIGGSPGGVPDEIDVTNHDSPGLYEEIITGIIRTKTITGVANYIGDNTQQNALLTAMEAGTSKNFKLVFPTATPKTFSFAGRVNGWDVDPPIRGAMHLNFSIKQSGAATIS